MKFKIFSILGSTRDGSVNEALLRGLAATYAETLDLEIFCDVASLPFFIPGLQDEQIAPAVRSFRDSISTADGVIISTPEYVFSMPGALKNALEWTVSTTVFMHKPLALIVAAGLGEKTLESLVLVMETLGAVIPSEAKLLLSGARAKVNEYGLITDSETQTKLKLLINALKDCIFAARDN